jgi:hypothetical protein
MKVLLKDARTGLYYQSTDAWVPEVALATEFDTVESAGKTAVTKSDADLNVLLKYENPHHEVELNPAYCVPWASLKSLATKQPPRLTA